MIILPSIKKTLGHWRWVVTHVFYPVWVAKISLFFTHKRVLKRRRHGHKLRIVFLVNEISKWKAQTLFDWLKHSAEFDPVVALFLTTDNKEYLSIEAQREKYDTAYRFFEQRGITPIEAYVPEENIYRPLSSLYADVIFYFQPWGLPLEYMPYEAAKTSLTCYIPYYVPNYGDLDVDCRQPFHRTLWTYFILNEEWASLYRNAVLPWMSSYKICGLGHPMLDCFNASVSMEAQEKYVIYAPHWSLDDPNNVNFENYGTFNLNGEFILAFAQKHSEIKWVFKPHPDLRRILVKIGWSEEKIADYYSAWEAIGIRCETGDYPAIFMKSRLMITDCGSFLTEYACTGNPILHLISPTCRLTPFQQSKQLYDLYYQARNLEELQNYLEQLVVRKEDPTKEDRIRMIERLKLRGNSAGRAIGEWLEKQLVK